ncbi:MAG: hypothetical protein J6Y02_12905 [Pseudobutyrivibrio sp.]|nr:hypothetical protein [Pseudobutyrivibrio sp.]
MGEFRKYRPYYACNALRFNSYANMTYNSSGDNGSAMSRVPEFKDITGTEYGWLLNLNSKWATYSQSNNVTFHGSSNQMNRGRVISNNYQHFVDLTPFATEDKLADYDIEDYLINPVGVTYEQHVQYVARDVNKILYSMSIFNDNVDSYVANDDTTFALDTFYALIDGNYVLLTEEPSDWSINYTGYYKILPAEDIKVSCIKFRKPTAASSNTSRSYANSLATENNQVALYTLYCAYFLDEEVTIHPGDSYLLSLSFESSQF